MNSHTYTWKDTWKIDNSEFFEFWRIIDSFFITLRKLLNPILIIETFNQWSIDLLYIWIDWFLMYDANIGLS